MKNTIPAIIFSALLFTGLSSCDKTTVNPNIRNGLVFYAPLNGNAKEETDKPNGVLHNTTPALDRKGNATGAVMFNAANNSYIDFGDQDDYSFTDNIFTIAFWVKSTSATPNVGAIISKRSDGGPFEYSIDNHFDTTRYVMDNWIANGSTTVYGTDPLNASATLPVGKWKFVCFVGDGQKLRAYVNGVEQSEVDMVNNGMSFANTTAKLQLGVGGAFGVNHYFTGAIDDLRIYRRPLRKEDIASLMAYSNTY